MEWSEVEGREMCRDVGGRSSAMRPGRSEKCIVMACDDCDEADQIDQEISKVNNGRLRTYYGLFDLMENPPQERIVAAILATRADPETIGQTLQWMRHRWPRCPMTVVGDVGGQEHELAARENGANFLTRPVTSSQWRAIVDHATGQAQFVEEFVEGGSSPARAGSPNSGLKGGRSPASLEPATARSRLRPSANVRLSKLEEPLERRPSKRR